MPQHCFGHCLESSLNASTLSKRRKFFLLSATTFLMKSSGSRPLAKHIRHSVQPLHFENGNGPSMSCFQADAGGGHRSQHDSEPNSDTSRAKAREVSARRLVEEDWHVDSFRPGIAEDGGHNLSESKRNCCPITSSCYFVLLLNSCEPPCQDSEQHMAPVEQVGIQVQQVLPGLFRFHAKAF